MEITKNFELQLAYKLQKLSHDSPGRLTAEVIRAAMDEMSAAFQQDFEWFEKRANSCTDKVLAAKRDGALVSHLNLGDFPDFPPIGKARFTRLERRRKIGKIMQMPVKYGQASAGASLVGDLFYDYYNFLADRLENALKKIELDNNGVWGKNYHFINFHMAVKLVFANLSLIKQRGSHWHMPIATFLASPDSIRNKALSSIAQARETEFFEFMQPRLPVMQEFREMFDLLEDCISQDLSLLFNPIENNVQFSGCFGRLKWRTQLLSQSVANFWETLEVRDIAPQFVEFPEEKNSLHTAIEEGLRLCEELDSKLVKDMSPSQVQDLLIYLLKISKHPNFSNMLNTVCSNLHSKKNNNETGILLMLSIYLLDLTQSTIDGALVACLASHFSARKDYKTIDSFLTNVCLALEALQKPLTGVKNKFDEFQQQLLTSEQTKILKELEMLFDFSCSLLELPTSLLSHRLFKIEQNSGNLERALAIRDVLYEIYIPFIKNDTNGMEALSRYVRLYLPPKELNPELHELANMQMEYYRMNHEIISGLEAGLLQMANHTEEPLVIEPPKVPMKRTGGKAKTKRRKTKSKTPAAKKRSESSNAKTVQAMPTQFKPAPFVAIEVYDSGDLQEAHISDVKFGELLRPLKMLKKKKFEHAEQQAFFLANLKNIQHVIEHLRETSAMAHFSLNTIFGETDALRRLMEFSLRLGIVAFCGSEIKHFDVIGLGHELHVLARKIMDSGRTPQNVQEVLQMDIAIPYCFSHANEYVNYLETARVKKNLPSSAMHLISYLSAVKKEADNKSPNAPIRESLMQIHERHVAHILAFSGSFLSALSDPSYKPEKKKGLTLSDLEKEFEAYAMDHDDTPAYLETQLTEGADAINAEADEECVPDLMTLEIYNREQAAQAINKALLWLRIRSIAPAQAQTAAGLHSQADRTTARNLRFENVRLYLLWLQEKLHAASFSPLYDLAFEEKRLLRRAFKEVQLALLYDGDYHVKGRHVVEESQLQRENNPCLLNAILRRHSANFRLPNLNLPRYKWLSAAHTGIAYPEPQLVKPPLTPWVEQIQQTVAEVSKYAKMRKKTAGGQSFVQNHKTWTAKKVDKEIDSFVSREECAMTFPALSALLQMLAYAGGKENYDVTT